MNLTDLKNILYTKLINSRLDYENLEYLIATLNDILLHFKEGNLVKLGKDYLQEKYQYQVTKYNVDTAIRTLENDLFITKFKYQKLKDYHAKLSKVINSLKYSQIISKDLVAFIKEELDKENVSNVDLINILERIKIHNSHCIDTKNKLSSNDLYLIVNLLNSGYEKITIPDNINKDKLILLATKTINLIDSNNQSTINDVLDLDKYQNSNDLTFIYAYILKHYQEEILNLVSILKDKEFYFDIVTLEAIKEEYKDLYQKYMYVRTLLDNIKQDYYEVTNPIEEIEFQPDPVKLYYSTNSPDIDKCYFVKDLLDIREESYQNILKLLSDFKNGNQTKAKYLASKEKGFIELKEDQVRIILKHLTGKNYSVMGVFIKKSDNEKTIYNNIMARPVAIIDDTYSEAVEKFYQDYIDKNSRLGTR